tara:strand:+ start:4960 stop:5388 length:429 start_codon:yes stop_codon:yes gene_type:complete
MIILFIHYQLDKIMNINKHIIFLFVLLNLIVMNIVQENENETKTKTAIKVNVLAFSNTRYLHNVVSFRKQDIDIDHFIEQLLNKVPVIISKTYKPYFHKSESIIFTHEAAHNFGSLHNRLAIKIDKQNLRFPFRKIRQLWLF